MIIRSKFLSSLAVALWLLSSACASKPKELSKIDQALVVADGIVKEMCACQTLACIDAIEARVNTSPPPILKALEGFDGKKPELTKEQQATVDALMTATGTCIDKVKPAKSAAVADEAELQLNALGKAARTYFAVEGDYPVLAMPLTPAVSACTVLPSHMHAPNPDAWKGGWETLEFSVTEPSRLQLSYEGTATGFVATAVEDLDCDGIVLTHKLLGKVVDGMPVVTLERDKGMD